MGCKNPIRFTESPQALSGGRNTNRSKQIFIRWPTGNPFTVWAVPISSDNEQRFGVVFIIIPDRGTRLLEYSNFMGCHICSTHGRPVVNNTHRPTPRRSPKIASVLDIVQSAMDRCCYFRSNIHCDQSGSFGRQILQAGGCSGMCTFENKSLGTSFTAT